MRAAIAAAALIVLASAGPVAAAPAVPPPPAQKVVKDAAEYNAYMLALNTADPRVKASAFEAFLTAYPNSILKTDALEQVMGAYQAAGDQDSLEGAAKRLLEAQPNDVRALAILTFLSRGRSTAGGEGQAAASAAASAYARRGLAAMPGWRAADGVTAEDFAALKLKAGVIFNGALGYDSLVRRDWAAARAPYREALQGDPSDLQNTYQYAIAELEGPNPDAAGFWWAAKAQALAAAAGNAEGQKAIAAYGRGKYVRWHGGADGWDAIVASASTQGAPPAGFKVARAPTPAEIAVAAVRDNDPATLSFSDWEFVLAQRDASPENRAAAAKVWAAIQAKQSNGAVRLKIPVTVLAATPDGFEAAITDEAVKAHVADMHVALRDPKTTPAPGATVSVTGVLTGYSPKPFRFAFGQAVVGP